MKKNSSSFHNLSLFQKKDYESQLTRSKSIPLLETKRERDFDNCRTSTGKPALDIFFSVEFEGDGPLGLKFNFNKKDNTMFVESIIKGTLAEEFEYVEPGIILQRIEGRNVSTYTFNENLLQIEYLWRKKGTIVIDFRKHYDSKINKLSDNKINISLYELLRKVNCEYYYTDFIKLGAKTREDLDFIEYNDLVKMNMSQKNRTDFCKEYNIKEVDKDKNSGIFQIPSDPSITENEESLLTEEEKEKTRLDLLFQSKFK